MIAPLVFSRLALALFTAVTTAHKPVPETVHFPSANGGVTLIGFLFKPSGGGSHPAIVMLHGRAGPYSSAAHGRYDALLSAGVRIWEYRPSTLHAQTFVADGLWSSIGTMNFDNRSLALDDESTMMILDPETGEQMEKIFFEDLTHATEIDLAKFRRRPQYEHIAEWGANLLTRLL